MGAAVGADRRQPRWRVRLHPRGPDRGPGGHSRGRCRPGGVPRGVGAHPGRACAYQPRAPGTMPRPGPPGTGSGVSAAPAVPSHPLEAYGPEVIGDGRTDTGRGSAGPVSYADARPRDAADLQRDREHPPRARRIRAALPEPPPCCDRRRQSRRHRRPGREARRGCWVASTCCDRVEVRSGLRLPGRVPCRARTRLRRLHRDGRRPVARARGAARPGRGRGGGRRARHRIPVHPGRCHPELGVAPAAAVRGAAISTPPPCSGSAWPTPPPDSRAYAAPLLARLDLDAVRAEGYGFQIGDRPYAAKRAGARDPRGADPVRRPGRGRIEDVHLHRGRGPGPGHPVGRPATVRLPSARSEVVHPDAPAVTAPVRVLVVDDEPYITDVVSSALAFEGFATEETSTVAGALACPTGGFDCIVLDVLLPDGTASRSAGRCGRRRSPPPYCS